MDQLEIKFFYPLTEQIALDLDYEPCRKYEQEKTVYTCVSSGTSGNFILADTFTGEIRPSFQIDIDAAPIRVVSKNKPNVFRRYIYSIMGIEWATK